MININSFLLQNPWRKGGYIFPPSIKRDIFPSLLPYLSKEYILVITGARQVGKSTLMQQIMEHLITTGTPRGDIFYFNLDDEEMAESIGRPAEFVMFIQRLQHRNAYIFLDEVQRLSNPGLFLKYIYDLKIGCRIIVSGSSSLEIHSRLTEHLTGRKISFNVYPFSFKEFIRHQSYDVFNEIEKTGIKETPITDINIIYGHALHSLFMEFCTFGGYPGVVIERDFDIKRKLIKEIYSGYVKKDIKDFMKIENVSGFNRIVNILSHQIGNMVNVHELSNTLGMHRNTIDKYINILEETFIFKRVKPFFTNARKELSKMPKIYITDLGLRNAMVDNFRLLDLHADMGKIVENFVFTELLKCADDPDSIRFWRTQGGAELDFIVNTNPIEVKYITLKRPTFFRTLRNYIELYKPVKGFVITKDYTVEAELHKTKLTFIPAYLIPWIAIHA